MFTHARLLSWLLVWVHISVSTSASSCVATFHNRNCHSRLSHYLFLMCIKSHGVIPDESDRPPVANGGQDQVVQPQDSVTLNGIGSKDDHGIASYKWKMLTEYPYAVTEVSEGPAIQTLFCYTTFSNSSLGK